VSLIYAKLHSHWCNLSPAPVARKTLKSVAFCSLLPVTLSVICQHVVNVQTSRRVILKLPPPLLLLLLLTICRHLSLSHHRHCQIVNSGVHCSC